MPTTSPARSTCTAAARLAGPLFCDLEARRRSCSASRSAAARRPSRSCGSAGAGPPGCAATRASTSASSPWGTAAIAAPASAAPRSRRAPRAGATWRPPTTAGPLLLPRPGLQQAGPHQPPLSRVLSAYVVPPAQPIVGALREWPDNQTAYAVELQLPTPGSRLEVVHGPSGSCPASPFDLALTPLGSTAGPAGDVSDLQRAGRRGVPLVLRRQGRPREQARHARDRARPPSAAPSASARGLDVRRRRSPPRGRRRTHRTASARGSGRSRAAAAPAAPASAKAAAGPAWSASAPRGARRRPPRRSRPRWPATRTPRSTVPAGAARVDHRVDGRVGRRDRRAGEQQHGAQREDAAGAGGERQVPGGERGRAAARGRRRRRAAAEPRREQPPSSEPTPQSAEQRAGGGGAAERARRRRRRRPRPRRRARRRRPARAPACACAGARSEPPRGRCGARAGPPGARGGLQRRRRRSPTSSTAPRDARARRRWSQSAPSAERERRAGRSRSARRPRRRPRRRRAALGVGQRPGSSVRRHAPTGGVASPMPAASATSSGERRAGRERARRRRAAPRPTPALASSTAVWPRRSTSRPSSGPPTPSATAYAPATRPADGERAGQVLRVDEQADAEHRQRQARDDREDEQATCAGDEAIECMGRCYGLTGADNRSTFAPVDETSQPVELLLSVAPRRPAHARRADRGPAAARDPRRARCGRARGCRRRATWRASSASRGGSPSTPTRSSRPRAT